MSAKMDEQALLALLRELAIDSQRVEHPAIASIEEYYAQGIELPDQGIKNLFLRNRKGTRHYLVLLDERKEADLPGIAEQDRRKPPVVRLGRAPARIPRRRTGLRDAFRAGQRSAAQRSRCCSTMPSARTSCSVSTRW